MERQYMWGNDSVSLAFEVNADGEYTVSIDKAVAEKYKLGESGATVEILHKGCRLRKSSSPVRDIGSHVIG